MLEKLSIPEKDLLKVSVVFFILSVPYLLSANFAGLSFPKAKQLYLLDYDWFIRPETPACYSYVWDEKQFTNCTTLEGSSWVSISTEGKTVKFFVNISDYVPQNSTKSLEIVSISNQTNEFEDVTVSYKITEGGNKGTVNKVSYECNGKLVGGNYVRLMPREEKTVKDTFTVGGSGSFECKIIAGGISDSANITVIPVWSVPPVLGFILACLVFVVPGFLFSKKSSYAILYSLSILTGVCMLLEFSGLFGRTYTWWIILPLIGAGIVGKKLRS